MKTRVVHWYENLFAYLLAYTQTFFMILVATIIALFVIFQGQAFSIEINNIPLWHSAFYLPSILAVFIGFLLWMSEKRIRLFDYERKNDLIPFIKDISIPFPDKAFKDIIDWRENKEFEATIYYEATNSDVLCWANDGKNLFVIKHKVFTEHLINYKNNNGIKGTWKWKWHPSFIELVLIKPAITRVTQLEFDFGV